MIDYLALSDEEQERSGAKPRPIWQHVFRFRTMLYTALWASIGLAMLYALFIRSDIGLTVAPVTSYVDSMVRLARRYVSSPDLADDVVQEAFLRLAEMQHRDGDSGCEKHGDALPGAR